MDEVVDVTRTRKGQIMRKYTCGDTFGKVIKTNFLVLAWVCLVSLFLLLLFIFCFTLSIYFLFLLFYIFYFYHDFCFCVL